MSGHRSVEAGRGIAWLGEAFSLVMKNPAVFLVQGLIFAIAFTVLNFIPILGNLAAIVLAPVAMGGIVYAMREQDVGAGAKIEHMFEGFRDSSRLVPLMLLSIPGFVGGVLLAILAFVLLGAAFVSAGMGAAANSSALAGGGMMMSALVYCVLALVIAFMIYALMVFALPRVMLERAEAFSAMKESLTASIANIVPIAVFVVVFFVVALVGTFVLSIIPILGTIVAMLVLTAVSAAAMYVAYKDVYGVALPPESVIVPPAPPSPPTV